MNLQTSLHAVHQTERNHIIDAFEKTPALLKRTIRLNDCASHGRLYFDGDPPEVRLWIYRCCDRLCPLCARQRSRKVAKQLMEVLQLPGVTRHMVLTIRTVPADNLQDAIKHLRESFRRIRRTPQWKEKVSGGAYVVEITRNQKDGRWHPHLHLLANGFYFPVKLLAALWVDATDGSTNIFISAAHGKHANHLAKYAAKPAGMEKWPCMAISEYAIATHGTRMVQTFGNVHGLAVDDSDTQKEPAAIRTCISLQVLSQHAAAMHPGAIALVQAIAVRWPRLWQYLRSAVDLPPPREKITDQTNLDRYQKAVNHTAKYCLSLTVPLKSREKRSYSDFK